MELYYTTLNNDTSDYHESAGASAESDGEVPLDERGGRRYNCLLLEIYMTGHFYRLEYLSDFDTEYFQDEQTYSDFLANILLEQNICTIVAYVQE